MLNSAQLKQITTEARPIIERMLEDADRLAGLRDVVAAHGGDWGQLKALIKAQIKDEQDEAGDGKHVRKILDKADYATAYADMLGLAKMNEENFSGADIPHDADTGEIIEPTPAAQIAEGLTEALAVVKGEAEPHRVHQIPGNGAGTAGAGDEVALDAPASAGTSSTAARMDVQRPAEAAHVASEADREIGEAGGRTRALPAGTQAPPVETTSSNILHLRTHNPDTHFLSAAGLQRLHGCRNPDACAGSWRALCHGCGGGSAVQGAQH